jgi:hypothetical protein
MTTGIGTDVMNRPEEVEAQQKNLAALANEVSKRISTHGFSGYCRKHLVMVSETGFCWKCRQENERT